MINVLKMILEIKARPLLWDPSHEMYSDRFAKKTSWEDVASVVMPDFEVDATEDDKKGKVEIVRRKWKSISDYYKKEKKEASEGMSKPKKYVFADVLTFLDPLINYEWPRKLKPYSKESTDSNISIDLEEALIQAEISEPEQDVERKSPPPKNKKKRRKHKKSDPLASEHDVAAGNTDMENEEADKLFLLSFLPAIRSMTEVQKIEFKIQMLKTYKQIRYSEESHQEPSSSRRKRKKHFLKHEDRVEYDVIIKSNLDDYSDDS